MATEYKTFKTLKELCKEAGLEPIPFVPVLRSVEHAIKNKTPKTDRKYGRTRRRATYLVVWVCTCGWEGAHKDLIKYGDDKVLCPKCNGRDGGEVKLVNRRVDERVYTKVTQ